MTQYNEIDVAKMNHLETNGASHFSFVTVNFNQLTCQDSEIVHSG